MHFYKTYGLVIASELVLPELIPWQSSGISDVCIITQSLGETLENASFTDNTSFSDMSFQVAQDCCQINVQGVARYRIEQGKNIFVDIEPGVAAGDVRLYLIGSSLGALLHQRRCLPLHVSSVVTPDGVWAFTGDSGAGKSTLAAALHYKFGWPLLSDDVGVILPDESGKLLFHPGPPRLKLWIDALEHLNISQNELMPDLTRTNKFHLSLEQGFQQRPQPLSTLVWLERANPSEAPRLLSIEGIQAFQAVFMAVYRPNFANYLNDKKTLFTFCSSLSKQIQVCRYSRPWSLDSFANSLQPIVEKIRKLEIAK